MARSRSKDTSLKESIRANLSRLMLLVTARTALSKIRRLQMLSADEMKALIDESIELGNELRRYHEFEDEPAKAHPAPRKAVLDSFAKRFKGKLPPSYLQLLSIYNGVENYEWVDVSILPIEFLMENDKLDGYWID